MRGTSQSAATCMQLPQDSMRVHQQAPTTAPRGMLTIALTKEISFQAK